MKGQQKTKSKDKTEPTMTLKEKRAAKRAKRDDKKKGLMG